MAGGADVGDSDGHAIVDDVQDFADQYARVQRHRLSGFDIEIEPGLRLDGLKKGDEVVDLVVGAGNMVAAAKIQPFKIGNVGHDARFDRCPGALEREEILFAQIVDVEAIHAFQMLRPQLVDRKAEPTMRLRGVIFGHFAFGMERVQAQADVEVHTVLACSVDDRLQACDLAGAVEDDMIGNAQNFGEIIGLVGGAIGRDLTTIFLSAEARFIDARGADAVKIFADDGPERPHGKSLERAQHFDATAITNVAQDRKVAADRGLVHHKGGRGDAIEVEAGKGGGIAGAGFHNNNSVTPAEAGVSGERARRCRTRSQPSPG